jgi:hypothetical protein
MPTSVGMSASREDALSARCKSAPGIVAVPEIEGNCVAARRGGEQPEVNRQSVEPAPAKAGGDEPVSAGSRGEPAHVWRSLEQLMALKRLILKATIGRITWLRSECRDGKAG